MRNKGKKSEQQAWESHWSLRYLQKIWMVMFAAFKVVVGAVSTVLLICCICGFVFAGLMASYLQEDIMPTAGMELGGYDLDLTSFIYNVNSEGQIEVLQQLYATTNREIATYEEIPQDLIHSTVAIEDKRFYEHQGVDWITTVKAFANMFFGSSTVGGSSITQQLVKNLTGEDSVTVQRKLMEFFRAANLEKRYSKEIIITEYLNSIYMGQGCIGVKSAAEVYFGKELQMLTTAECASLISITNNPSLFDPYSAEVFTYAGELRNGMERNQYRQRLVLGELLNQGWITREKYDQSMAQKLVLKNGIDEEDRWVVCENEECGYQGIVSTLTKEGDNYLCKECGSEVDVTSDASENVYSWFVDTVLEDVAHDLAMLDGVEWNDETKATYKRLIGRSGYHIYSTIDEDVQAQVDLIYKDLNQIPDTYSAQQLESGIVVIHNLTGDIIAMAGGVGEKTDFDAFNIATDSELQSGSSIKPLSIYAPAFEAGYSPASVVKDLPLFYEASGSPWPRNDNRLYSGSRTLYSAIEDSVNAVAANTLSAIGTGYGFRFAKETFGLSTLVDGDNDFAPLAMGAQTYGVTIRDMSAAYATFANDGKYREARTYTKVYDTDGNLVLDNTQDSKQILTTKTVEYMNYCLVNAVNAGTGNTAQIDGAIVAGKTGSTSQFRDRWFCGFTGYYTAAVWCGYKTPEVINLVDGSYNPASLLWRKVMAPLHKGLDAVELYSTKKMTQVSICTISGKLATAACSNDCRGIDCVDNVMVYWEDRPSQYCDAHVTVDYCTTGNGVANQYCKHFADAGVGVTLSDRVLIKMTAAKMREIKAAIGYGLSTNYLSDGCIYLIEPGGGDASFTGLNGNINANINAPYKACTVHTQTTWDAYQNAHMAD